MARQQIRLMLPMVKKLIDQDPAMVGIFEQTMKQCGPIAEDYIMSLFAAYSERLR
jgi:hypothetical protein